MQTRTRKVKVQFYSGYQGEETPRSVILEDKEISVDQILQRKRVLSKKTWESWDEYTIKLNGQTAVLKKYSSGDCELISDCFV